MAKKSGDFGDLAKGVFVGAVIYVAFAFVTTHLFHNITTKGKLL